jgi:hypothetical protein
MLVPAVLVAAGFAAAGHLFAAGDFAAAGRLATTAVTAAAETEELKSAGLTGQTQQTNRHHGSNNTIPHGRGS